MKFRVEESCSWRQIVNDCAPKSLAQLQGLRPHLSKTHLLLHTHTHIHTYILQAPVLYIRKPKIHDLYEYRYGARRARLSPFITVGIFVFTETLEQFATYKRLVSNWNGRSEAHRIHIRTFQNQQESTKLQMRYESVLANKWWR